MRNPEYQDQSKGSYFNVLLLLISPLVSYCIALLNYKNPSSKNVVWFFSAFFGFCLQIPAGLTGDSAVYRDKFLEYYQNNHDFDYLFSLFFSNRGHIEIVGNLISVTVAQFTGNYHYLFLCYGLFFGYFFSRNIAYMYKHFTGNLRNGSILLTFALTFVIPIWNINGFDFWTASQVFVFALLPIIYENKYRRIIFLLLCPLIHFSFYFMILICILFYFVKNFKKVLVVSFILSYFFTGIDPAQFAFIFNYFPDILTERTEAYVNSTKSNTGGNILRIINMIYSFCIYFVFYRSYIKNKMFIANNRNIERLFLFSFYIIAVFNVLSVIPSVGRFLLIGQMFIFISLFILLNNSRFKSYQIISDSLNSIRIVLIVFWVISMVRYLFPILGIGSIISNPFLVWFFVEDDIVIGNVLEFLNN